MPRSTSVMLIAVSRSAPARSGDFGAADDTREFHSGLNVVLDDIQQLITRRTPSPPHSRG